MLLIKSVLVGMALLGFKRGINSYDYKYNKNNINKSLTSKEPYFYSHKICSGLYGIIIYTNPVLFFVVVPKEIYILEVNLRGLEDEKKTDYYNLLHF
jgi:hypothetical protein